MTAAHERNLVARIWHGQDRVPNPNVGARAAQLNCQVAIAVASDAANLAVLRIGHLTSIRSAEALSLRDALAKVNYGEVRKALNVRELREVIARQPRLIEDWDLYSADKRTTGGWYLNAKRCEIGQIDLPSSMEQFSTPEETVAEYVLRELDFWYKLRSPPNFSLERTREG